jgi:hypothetical protein
VRFSLRDEQGPSLGDAIVTDIADERLADVRRPLLRTTSSPARQSISSSRMAMTSGARSPDAPSIGSSRNCAVHVSDWRAPRPEPHDSMRLDDRLCPGRDASLASRTGDVIPPAEELSWTNSGQLRHWRRVSARLRKRSARRKPRKPSVMATCERIGHDRTFRHENGEHIGKYAAISACPAPRFKPRRPQ